MTRILLTRHGQTVWNIEKRVQGILDSPLTEIGILQARFLAVRLRDEGIEHIYSSNSLRAVGTAEEIRCELGLKTLSTNPGLREFDFGEWEGCTWQEIQKVNPDIFKSWQSEPHLVTPPGGDNMVSVMERAWNCVQQIISNHVEETICVVTHGLTLKMIVTKALGLEVHEWAKTPLQNNTALNIFEVVENQWRPRLIGDCKHLEELELN